MSKPNPFYKDESGKQLLIQMRNSFKYSELETKPKLIILISGREGLGKTHLACTMSEVEPVYLIDTEYRAQIVIRKFNNVKFTTAKNYSELVVAVNYIIRNEQSGTIVIDSGSDLQTFSEIEYLERTDKERVGLPFNWAEVWRLCNAVIDEIKFSQNFNLVITSRMKEEYINDKPSGKSVPRIYSALPYKADIMLELRKDKEVTLEVTKNGFDEIIPTQLKKSSSLPSIISQLANNNLTINQIRKAL